MTEEKGARIRRRIQLLDDLNKLKEEAEDRKKIKTATQTNHWATLEFSNMRSMIQANILQGVFCGSLLTVKHK